MSRSLAECQLTHIAREPIDLAAARDQHRRYEETLATLGCTVVRVPEAPDLPDAVFIEDVAVVLDEVAVMTRPGAESRRAESGAVADALGAWRPLVRMTEPATLDGGDVLHIGKTLFVGMSHRTNEAGITQLADAVGAHGYTVCPVEIRGALHLKTAVTSIGNGLLLVNPEWVDPAAIGGTVVEVDNAEPFAANALVVGNTVVHSTAFPKTQRRLTSRGLTVYGVDASELAKAEGGVTCCSLLFR